MSPRSLTGDLRTQLWHLRHGGVSQWRTYRRRAGLPAGPSASAVVTGAGRDAASAGNDGPQRTVSFAAQEWPERAPVRGDLTAAVILDDFSLRAFHYEWHQVVLTRRDWRAELAAQPVDLLFVESAWHGNADEWQYQLTGTSGVKESMRELVAHCREQGIPTVFWNKEDPPHYDDFLECARLFDIVFTTDVNKIPDYHRDLGHERVGVLPFAAQPAVHNPARPRNGFHERDVAFGGMYFAHKFPERREQMDVLLGGAHDASAKLDRGLEIFSRYLGQDERYQFPEPLDQHVVGSLGYDQMLTAYKAYRVFLNVNSVVDSPSMCARRIFEITACGTPVVSHRPRPCDGISPTTNCPLWRTASTPRTSSVPSCAARNWQIAWYTARSARSGRSTPTRTAWRRSWNAPSRSSPSPAPGPASPCCCAPTARIDSRTPCAGSRPRWTWSWTWCSWPTASTRGRGTSSASSRTAGSSA